MPDVEIVENIMRKSEKISKISAGIAAKNRFVTAYCDDGKEVIDDVPGENIKELLVNFTRMRIWNASGDLSSMRYIYFYHLIVRKKVL